MTFINFVVTVLGIAVACIPLVLKLIQYVQKAVKEKNWTALLNLVLELMEEAEEKFADGETRKEWVLAMVQVSEEYLNYEIDVEELSDLIEELCDMSKIVNVVVSDETDESEVELDSEISAGADSISSVTEDATTDDTVTAEDSSTSGDA